MPAALPSEASPAARTVTRRGVLVAVLAGSLGAALVGGATLPGWADKLPESAAATAVGDAARAWEAALARVGLTRPYAEIRTGPAGSRR